MGDKNSSRAQLVLFYVQRIEACDEEIARQQAVLKDKKDDRAAEMKAAKSEGLDADVLQQMVRERRMDPMKRRAYLTKCELYRAACGDLDGRSLSRHARGELMPKPPNSETRTEDERQDELPEIPPVPAAPEEEPITPEAIEAAKKEGAETAAAGRLIFENPYPADDPRRAAWDEGWMTNAGHDGLDIPAYLQPKKKGGDGSANDDNQPADAA